jgi:hypothetical protein
LAVEYAGHGFQHSPINFAARALSIPLNIAESTGKALATLLAST